jgi:hypothetical protein
VRDGGAAPLRGEQPEVALISARRQ